MLLVAGLFALQVGVPWFDISRSMDGWQYHGTSEGQATVTLFKPGPRASMIWVRFEPRQVVDGIGSQVQLTEVRCVEGQSRVLQQTNYSGHNLTGRSTVFNNPTAWIYSTPGTVSEGIFNRACGFMDN